MPVVVPVVVVVVVVVVEELSPVRYFIHHFHCHVLYVRYLINR
jgi:hypothetical protein